jgi:hypothetical protein
METAMSDQAAHKAPTWFMVVAAVLLIWNLLGVMAYLINVTMSPEALAALPEAQRQLYDGVLGCVLLLLKKNLAGLVLQLSLAGVVVQMFHSFFVSNSFEVFGPGGLVMPIMVIVIAVFLVWLAARAKMRRWTS